MVTSRWTFLKRMFNIFMWSIAAGLVTAYAFAMSFSGEFVPEMLFIPATLPIASIVGVTMAIVLYPYAYWCLRGNNRYVLLRLRGKYQLSTCFVLVVGAYISIILAQIIIRQLVEAIDTRPYDQGPGVQFGFLFCVLYWIVSLLSVRLFLFKSQGPPACTPDPRPGLRSGQALTRG